VTPSPTPAVVASKKGKPLVWLAWIAILSLIAYFLIKNALHYFVVTPDSYGGYFWLKIRWLLPHVASGLLALVIGPLQFWPKMRRDYLPFHRIAGRIYVVTVLIGSVAGWGMASTIEGAPVYALGLSSLALAWITTTGMAFIAVRRKNIAQHKQWMVRSYVVTFAFVTFRLVSDLLTANDVMPDDENSALMAWACWAVPLLIAEVTIQARDVFKRRPVRPAAS